MTVGNITAEDNRLDRVDDMDNVRPCAFTYTCAGQTMKADAERLVD
jgi:hypothetical protein